MVGIFVAVTETVAAHHSRLASEVDVGGATDFDGGGRELHRRGDRVEVRVHFGYEGGSR